MAKTGTSLALELSIECVDERAAEMLNAVLMPDNRYFPRDQRFTVERHGATLRFGVTSPRARPAFSTVASILSDARLFQEVWHETRPR